MSCTEAFDQLTACYSLGGQTRHYYRFGTMDDCLRYFNKFKFCIMDGGDPVKVQQFYQQQYLENKKTKGNSEDVWGPALV